MSTSTSRADAVVTLRHPGSSKWLTIPPLDERMSRRIERTLGDVLAKLPKQTLLIHRTLRISNPPRKVELEIHHIEHDEEVITMTQVKLANGQRRDWENICPDLIAVASELATRWPEAVRPEDIALVTDGCSLWFNPGRPDGLSQSWLRDHLTGKSPCAMIHKGQGEMPLKRPHPKPNPEVN